MVKIATFDLGMTITGVCVGDGATTPRVEPWKFGPVGTDLGDLGDLFLRNLDTLHRRTGFARVGAEAPFLDRYRDKTIVLRKTFGLGFALQTFCFQRNIPFQEFPFGDVKRELSGTPKADKAAMVRVAKRCGIALPEGPEEEDCADAFAVWLIMIRLHAKQHLPTWDRKRFSSPGALPL